MTRKVPQTTSSGSSVPSAAGSPSTAIRAGASLLAAGEKDVGGNSVSSPARVSVGAAPAAKSKYRAIPVEIDGIRFASKAERNRYLELKLLEHAGEISRLELQPSFKCVIDNKLVCTYRADFSYFDKSSRVVEDVKGMKTPVYRLKKKLVEALYPGVVIKEV